MNTQGTQPSRQTRQHTRRHSFLRLSLFTVLLILLCGSVKVHANSDAESKAAAIASALEQNGPGGKVIGVKKKSDDDGSSWFEVKILTDGKVRIFKISDS